MSIERRFQEVSISDGPNAGILVEVSISCFSCGELLVIDKGSLTESQFFALQSMSFQCAFCEKSQTEEALSGMHDQDWNEWSPSYDDYLKSPTWKALRDAAIERADGRCQVCNSDLMLHVHHRKYPKILGHEEKGDLTVLCRRCHDLFHGNTTHRSRRDK